MASVLIMADERKSPDDERRSDLRDKAWDRTPPRRPPTALPSDDPLATIGGDYLAATNEADEAIREARDLVNELRGCLSPGASDWTYSQRQARGREIAEQIAVLIRTVKMDHSVLCRRGRRTDPTLEETAAAKLRAVAAGRTQE